MPLRRRLFAAPWETVALRIAVTVAVVFGLAWVAYKAQQDPRVFFVVGLNGLTLAGLYFVVASGFTLLELLVVRIPIGAFPRLPNWFFGLLGISAPERM